MFSNVKNNEERYKIGHFIPNNISDFELSEKAYNVLLRATSLDRNNRYKTIQEFEDNFFKNI